MSGESLVLGVAIIDLRNGIVPSYLVAFTCLHQIKNTGCLSWYLDIL